MIRAVVWGTGLEYARHLMELRCQEAYGYLEIIGVTSNETCYQRLDGYPFVPKEELAKLAPDLVIVTVDRSRWESVAHEAASLGLDPATLVHVSVFSAPGFDLALYMELREHPLSIVSINCWGGEDAPCPELDVPLAVRQFLHAGSGIRPHGGASAGVPAAAGGAGLLLVG